MEKISKGQKGFFVLFGFFEGCFKDGEEQCKNVASSVEIWCLLSSGSTCDGQPDASLLSRLGRRSRFCGPLKKTMLLDDLELESLQSICNITFV